MSGQRRLTTVILLIPSPQQDQRPGQPTSGAAKGGAGSPGAGHGHTHRGFPELQVGACRGPAVVTTGGQLGHQFPLQPLRAPCCPAVPSLSPAGHLHTVEVHTALGDRNQTRGWRKKWSGVMFCGRSDQSWGSQAWTHVHSIEWPFRPLSQPPGGSEPVNV